MFAYHACASVSRRWPVFRKKEGDQHNITLLWFPPSIHLLILIITSCFLRAPVPPPSRKFEFSHIRRIVRLHRDNDILLLRHCCCRSHPPPPPEPQPIGHGQDFERQGARDFGFAGQSHRRGTMSRSCCCCCCCCCCCVAVVSVPSSPL